MIVFTKQSQYLQLMCLHSEKLDGLFQHWRLNNILIAVLSDHLSNSERSQHTLIPLSRVLVAIIILLYNLIALFVLYYYFSFFCWKCNCMHETQHTHKLPTYSHTNYERLLQQWQHIYYQDHYYF